MALEGVHKYLKKHGLRITTPRTSVALTLIERQGDFLSPEEIHHSIQSNGEFSCDLVSVYRVLKKYEEIGLVFKSSFRGEANRYAFAPESGEKSHKHFFKCVECNLIEPLKGCIVAKKEKELNSLGYQNLTHHLEISGLCPKCAT